MSLLLFMLPSESEPGKRILDWETARHLPWDIVLLLGGGFVLAAGFQSSRLSLWVDGQLSSLSSLHPAQIVLIVCLIAALLTEFASNSATTQVLLPIVGALAVSLRLNPLLLMIPATFSCSFALMLPVSTPPNAVVVRNKAPACADHGPHRQSSDSRLRHYAHRRHPHLGPHRLRHRPWSVPRMGRAVNSGGVGSLGVVGMFLRAGQSCYLFASAWQARHERNQLRAGWSRGRTLWN